MLCRIQTLEGHTVIGTNGRLGQVVDFLFDDASWVIRYLVVDTGDGPGGRLVLISPRAIGMLDPVGKALIASVTKEQVARSPNIDMERSVSLQKELQLGNHYGYPIYWGGTSLWGNARHPDGGLLPVGASRGADVGDRDPHSGRPAPPSTLRGALRHLRSGRALLRYCVDANDGEVGHIDGLLVDERTWAIHQLVVCPRDPWIGHRVLIEPSCIEAVTWNEEAVSIGVSREALRTAFPPKASSSPDVFYEPTQAGPASNRRPATNSVAPCGAKKDGLRNDHRPVPPGLEGRTCSSHSP